MNIDRLAGADETRTLGGAASPDDLRVELSEAFAPFLLQEELGGNLKAVDLNLVLLQLVVGTRLGWGFRQGITNELLVVDGDTDGTVINLVEVDDYNTHGPILGATAKVSVTRWLFGQAEFSMMAPLKDKDRAGDDFGERLLLDFSGTAGFKIPSIVDFLFASFDYSFRIERDGFLTHDTQLDHSLMARANVTLF